MSESNERKETDFTRGSIYGKMIRFSIPLLIGNLLQQIYFIADSIVVGQLIGKTALAAVGASAAVTIILVFFFQGISTGAGIMISQNIGAGRMFRIRHIVRAASVLVIVLGGILSFVGFLLSEKILIWTSVPDSVMDQAVKYLMVAMGGILPMLVYNMGASIMQAMGDSGTPLYYLLASSIINIVLDVVFVSCMGTGVEGTAVATVIAQAVSAVLIFMTIHRKAAEMSRGHVGKVNQENINAVNSDNMFALMRKILYIGIPIGIEQVVINLANIIIQNHINGIGADAMAGWSIFCRVDTFVILPFISFGIAVVNFTGQNYGSGKYERIFTGLKSAMKISVSVTVAISIVICAFPEFFFRFFTDDRQVLDYACQMIWCMVPGYFLLAASRVFSSTVSGTGNSLVPMLTNVLFMCVLRVTVLPVFTEIAGHNMTALYMTFWLSWVMTCAVIGTYYNLRTKKQLKAMAGVV